MPGPTRNPYNMPTPPATGGGTVECDGFLLNDGAENVFRQPVAIGDPSTWGNAAAVAGAALAGTEQALATRSIDSPPNSSFLVGQTSVGTSAVQISSVSPAPNRRTMKVKNFASSGGAVYIGFSSGMTASSGHELSPGESEDFDYGPTATLWAIGAVAGNTVSCTEAG